MPDNLITSDRPFSDSEQVLLRAVAGAMIPRSKAFGVPGADDEAIFATIATRALRHQAAIRHGLSLLGGFNERPATLLARLQALQQEAPLALGAMVSVITSAYYEDDRVLASIGHDPRPPFPRGHSLEAGDWSLLDPVRQRAPFYRKVEPRS